MFSRNSLTIFIKLPTLKNFQNKGAHIMKKFCSFCSFIFCLLILILTKPIYCFNKPDIINSAPIETKVTKLPHIVLLPITASNNNSELIDYSKIITDSIKHILNSSLSEFVTFEISYSNINIDSLQHINHINLQNRLCCIKAPDLIISGRVKKDTQGQLFFSPVLIPKLINKNADSKISLNKISGKTINLKKFEIETTTQLNIDYLINYLSGFSLLYQKKYEEAIKIFKNYDLIADCFYLSECFLRKADILKENIKRAHSYCDSSILYLNKCLELSKNPIDSLSFYNNIGVAWQALGRLNDALTSFNRAKDFVHFSRNHCANMKVANNLGNIYLLKGNWKEALNIFQSNISRIEHSNDSLSLVISYENMGNIYQLIRQRNKAIKYYNLALDYRIKMKDSQGIATSYYFLGDVFQEKKNYDNSIEYFKKSLDLNIELKNEPRIANIYDRFGQLFYHLNQLDSAIFYYQKSYDIFKILGDSTNLIRNSIHQATVYQFQKKFELVINLYESALNISKSINHKSLQAQIYDRIGDIYNTRNDLTIAYNYYVQSVEIYEKIGKMENVSLILYNMGLIRLKENNHAEGYDLLKKAIDLDEENSYNNFSNEKSFLSELEIILFNETNN